mmetsp:Transcript_5928/g.6489  ORF Transcript_5928/g.6489 Transcript_5928/m.6489 type:complete len:231 (-) Transcript_5928:27-719(-)
MISLSPRRSSLVSSSSFFCFDLFNSCFCLFFCVSSHSTLQSLMAVGETSEATTRAPQSAAKIETKPVPHPISSTSYPSKFPKVIRNSDIAKALGHSLPPYGLSLSGFSHHSTSSTSTVHTLLAGTIVFFPGRFKWMICFRILEGGGIVTVFISDASSAAPSFFGLPLRPAPRGPPILLLFLLVFFAHNFVLLLKPVQATWCKPLRTMAKGSKNDSVNGAANSSTVMTTLM